MDAVVRRAIVVNTVELADGYRLDTMNRAGIVVATAWCTSAVVRPDGLSRIWDTCKPYDRRLSVSVSDRGRVALLDTYPNELGAWPTKLRFASLESDEDRVVDANATGSLRFDYGTRGIVSWADEDTIWLGAADDSETGLWIGRLSLESGMTCGASFEDPYAESEFSIHRPPTAQRCSFNVHAGQHGGWAFEAQIADNLVKSREARLGQR
jgi:hypothetical protein